MSVVITIDDLRDYAGPSVIADDDARALQVVDATNEAIERATGRVWGGSVTVEEFADFASVIFLRNMDIISVISISRGTTELPATSYKWRSNGRVVLSLSESGFHPRYDELSIRYTYGNLDVPADLKQAALSAALDAYNYVDAEGQQKEVTSEQIGSLRYTYANGSSSSTGGGYAAAIRAYRMPNL